MPESRLYPKYEATTDGGNEPRTIGQKNSNNHGLGDFSGGEYMTQVNKNTEADAPYMLPVTCDVCGEEAEHRVGIAANERDALVHWRGLCDEHLKELGEWWSK